jgi:hypothetical protein
MGGGSSTARGGEPFDEVADLCREGADLLLECRVLGDEPLNGVFG